MYRWRREWKPLNALKIHPRSENVAGKINRVSPSVRGYGEFCKNLRRRSCLLAMRSLGILKRNVMCIRVPKGVFKLPVSAMAAWNSPNGVKLANLMLSLIVASVKFSLFVHYYFSQKKKYKDFFKFYLVRCSMDGISSRGTWASISCWTFSWISGWEASNKTSHSRLVEVVSVPAMNRSTIKFFKFKTPVVPVKLPSDSAPLFIRSMNAWIKSDSSPARCTSLCLLTAS